jgi:Fe-S-cluster-containing dehydrogenase component
MNLKKNERGTYPYVKVAFQPLLCQHCNDAPCSKVAEDGAVYKLANGAVIIDPKKAVGQRKIMEACPYGAVFWNEERALPQKCTLCAHRLEEGKEPRCVQICPSGCLTFGDLDDPNSEVSKLAKEAEVFHPEWSTNPNIYYLNLQRITKNLVAGSVVLGDVDDCAVGAAVTLIGSDGKSVQTVANFFGDFEFDAVSDGEYTLTVECGDYQQQTVQVKAPTDSYVGAIVLTKA